MLAVGLTVALFLFWAVVGYAVVSTLIAGGAGNRLQALLLAPVVGVVLTVIPLFTFNRLGVPVRSMSVGLLVFLVLLTVGLLVWRRPAVPWRPAAMFGGALALSLVLTARPMFEYGLNWLSYCNDDMANYCLSARWLSEHSLLDAPTPDEITNGTHHGKVYWMLYVPAMSRMGCELVLAWSCILTGVSEHQMFNPMIMSFHLALIAALGALVLRTPDMTPVALAASVLVSLSAMNTLGTLVQVIAQVIGLGVLCTWATLILRPFEGLTRGELIRHGALIGIVGAGQAILYAEVMPFLFLAFCAYTVVQVARGARPWRLLATLGIGTVVGVVLLRKHALTVITYITLQSAGGSMADDPLKSLMPYFLVPGGLANLWGLQPVANLTYEPWLSVSIALGGLLLLAAAAAAVWGTWRGHAVAAFALAMIALGPYLYMSRTGFGLFKLAMFAQPFLYGTLAVAWLGVMARRHALVRYVPLAVVGLSGVFVQQWYVQESRGTRGAFSLIPFATPSHVEREFASFAAAHRDARLVGDSYNIVLAKFQALHAQGATLILPSNDFFRSVMTYKEHLSTASPEALVRAKELTIAQDSVFADRFFRMYESDGSELVNKFHECTVAGYADESSEAARGTLLIRSTGIHGIYNRRSLPPPASFRRVTQWKNFDVVPYADVRNHLIPISSHLSQPFYYGDPELIGAYQLEPEPYWFRGSTMAAIGRYQMFQVVRPTQGVRLVVNFTCSYLDDGENVLPDAVVVGEGRRWRLGASGRGSARLFSPPLIPQRINDRDYVVLDMGREGRRFSMRRGWLMKLYGRDVALDRRMLVAFGRDVSAISDEEYRRIAPPAALQRFPDELANPDLEYSGIYEDGWCSESALAGLSMPKAADAADVIVRGMVPTIGGNKTFQTNVRVLVDGAEVASKTLGVGNFEVRGTVPASLENGTRRRVELRFTQLQRLPDDGRPVAARITFLGLTAAVAAPIAHMTTTMTTTTQP